MARAASPRRRRVAAVALVSLLVLAGCSAPTVSLHEAERPPGVRADHVVPEPLVAAHASALEQQSYTAVVHLSTPNRTIDAVLRVGPRQAYATYHLTVRVPSGTHEIRYYVTPKRVYLSRETPTGTVIRTRPAGPEPVRQLRRRVGLVRVVRNALHAAPLRPVGAVGRHGRTFVVLAGNLSASSAVVPADGVRVRLLVSERGVVRRTTFVAPQAAVVASWSVRDLGRTTVTRPGWTRAARADGDPES